MFVIKYAEMKNWRNLWLETNSMLVIRAFPNLNIISWNLLSKWKNTLRKICFFKFDISHIFREGNTCGDRLVNIIFFSLILLYYALTRQHYEHC